MVASLMMMMIHRITPRIQAQPLAAAYGRGTICLANHYLYFLLPLVASLARISCSIYLWLYIIVPALLFPLYISLCVLSLVGLLVIFLPSSVLSLVRAASAFSDLCICCILAIVFHGFFSVATFAVWTVSYVDAVEVFV